MKDSSQGATSSGLSDCASSSNEVEQLTEENSTQCDQESVVEIPASVSEESPDEQQMVSCSPNQIVKVNERISVYGSYMPHIQFLVISGYCTPLTNLLHSLSFKLEIIFSNTVLGQLSFSIVTCFHISVILFD